MAALPLAALPGSAAQKTPLKILMKSAWGSDDPTKAAFPFLHGLALAEAGHQVQIFLLGEAVNLMRRTVAHAVVPVGWPPLEETLEKAFLDTVRMEEYHSKIVKAGFVPLVLNSQQSIRYISEQSGIFKKLLAEHNLLLKQ
jgi:hypothetical protein